MGESSIGWLHPPMHGRRDPYGAPAMPGYTVNHWIGCTRADPECEHCYAETSAERGRLTTFREAKRLHLPVWGPKAPRHIVGDATLAKVDTWHRAAQGIDHRGRPIEGAIPWPRWVFGGSEMDWLENRDDLIEARGRMLATIERTPWLRWILLTKRPQNFAKLAPRWAAEGCPQNVWFGVSAGSQRSLDRKLEAFAAARATHKLISGEPLIAPVDFRQALSIRNVKWLILGLESGRPGHARPCGLEVVRDGIAAARELGRAVYVKQLGRVPLGSDCRGCEGEVFEGAICDVCGEHAQLVEYQGQLRKVLQLRHHKGEDPREWPRDLRIQEWPDGSAFLHQEAA